jgi:hypothetical protein
MGAHQENGVFDCPVENFALKPLHFHLPVAPRSCASVPSPQPVAAFCSSLYIVGMQNNSGIHFCLPEALMLDILPI